MRLGGSPASANRLNRLVVGEAKTPLLAEAFVFLFAVGLLAYALVDPHDFFNSPHGIGGFIAAVLLVAVIGRRALRAFRP